MVKKLFKIKGHDKPILAVVSFRSNKVSYSLDNGETFHLCTINYFFDELDATEIEES